MAKPQIENGYIRIANKIAEALMQTSLSAYQTRILWAIWRKTYGYNKKAEKITNKEFVEMTGIAKSNVSRTLKELKARNIITSSGDKIGFQKDYEKWQDISIEELRKTKKLSIRITQKTGKKLSDRITKVIHPDNNSHSIPFYIRKTKDKETKLKKLSEWITPQLWKEFKKHRIKLRKPMTEYAENRMLSKLKRYKEEGYDLEELVNITIEKGWQDIVPDWIYKDKKPKKRQALCLECKKKPQQVSGLCKECYDKK